MLTVSRLLFFFTFTSLFASCSSTRVNPLLSQGSDSKPTSPLSKKEIQLIEKKSKLLWDNRGDATRLKEFIELQEKIAFTESASETKTALLSRAYYFMADAHAKSEKEKIELWEKGANWGERALTWNPSFKSKIINEKLPPEMALLALEKKDAEALFWFASNLDQWAHRSGLNTLLKYKDRTKHMMERVEALNPHYFQGGVYRYYGVYYALAPGIEQNTIEQSEKNFKKAFKTSPDFFSTHVQFAETLAVKKNDLESFNSHLNFVIKGNPKQMNDFYHEQVLEQEKAKNLLLKTKELF